MVLAMYEQLRKYWLLAVIMCGASLISATTTADILLPDDVDSADADTLFEDTKIFNIISVGIALSIAECSGQEMCELTTDKNEIEQLIEVLDQRINSVLLRQQNDEAELADVVLAYVDTKEKYATYVDQLSQISKLEQEDSLFGAGEYSVFQDFEDELENELGLEEEDAFVDELDLQEGTYLQQDSHDLGDVEANNVQ